MPAEFGRKLKMCVFGKSHGTAIGVIVGGLPKGEKIDKAELRAFLSRRSPGKNAFSSARSEADRPLFLSGLDGEVITSPVLSAIILNTDVKSSDYEKLAMLPRPGHADYTAYVKWAGRADMRGGGVFSGRMTAPMCIAGGIAKQLLEKRGIYVGAHLLEVAGVRDDAFELYPPAELMKSVAEKELPVINDGALEKMKAAIAAASAEGDSVGGVIECAVTGLPAGVGGALFDGIESAISSAVFAIPAVKGVEFGAGFEAARMRGSENNDQFALKDGKIVTRTNNCGGILGGISNGMPLVFRAAVKPTPSIAKTQKTVRLSDMTETELSVQGRHDPCIAPRAVPAVEAMAAFTLLDMMMGEE